jgi:OmpA-OmpF porin, OOP family
MSQPKMPCINGRNTLLQSALITVITAAALIPVTSVAQSQNDPDHWYTPQAIVWKNATGLCWRSSSWVPADATAECDPELMAKAEVPVPKRAEAMTPPPAPALMPIPAPTAQTRKMTFSAEELFDFDKAVLKAEGKTGLDKLASEINGVDYDKVLVNGHTDRLGSHPYNQKLSERRANAVKAYLISKGIADNHLTSAGMGETQPVTKLVDCKGPVSNKLKACLQPDRRVEVEVTGSKEIAVLQ